MAQNCSDWQGLQLTRLGNDKNFKDPGPPTLQPNASTPTVQSMCLVVRECMHRLRCLSTVTTDSFALIIHKVQGLFLPSAILAFNKNVFSDGQASTASERLSYNAAGPGHRLGHDSEGSARNEKPWQKFEATALHQSTCGWLNRTLFPGVNSKRLYLNYAGDATLGSHKTCYILNCEATVQSLSVIASDQP